MLNNRITWASACAFVACTTTIAHAQGGASCSAAVQAIVGDNAYNNAGATVDVDYAGLCDMGPFGTDTNFNTVWFRWTATASDVFTLSTCGTAGGVDTRLSVQTGCTADTVIACNDDGPGCANYSSKLTFAATSGTLYYFAVGVYSATTAGGPGTMALTQGDGGGGGGGGGDCCVANPGTTCCSDQVCCDAVCAIDPYCCATEWDQVCANEAQQYCEACGGGGGGGVCGSGGDCCAANPGTPGCADQTCCETVCSADPYCCDTEWDQICVNQAVAVCAVCGGGSCDIPNGSQVEGEACGDDSNGGCNGGGANEPLESLNGSVAGTFWSSTSMRDTDWYTFTVSDGTTLTLSLFSNLPSFCAIVENPGCTIVGLVSAGNCQSTLTTCIGPGSYYVVCLPSQFAAFPCGGALGNDYTLTVASSSCDFTPPDGDVCSDPVVAQIGSNPFDNSNATTQFSDPTCGFQGAPFTKDLFFSFAVTAADDYTFETCTSGAFDTGIEVWSGCPDAGGSLLACNDDGPGCPNYSSTVSTFLDSGNYIIRVGGWNGDTGASDLVISQGAPAGLKNDNCDDAIPAIVGTNDFTTIGSTTDGPNPTDPSCGSFGAGFYNDVWFNFAAPATANFKVSLCGGATFDTRIDIYASCAFGVPVACNDDSCGLVSEVIFPATSGTTYKIRIGAYGAAGFGSGTFVITNEGGGGGGGGGQGLTCANPFTLSVGATAFNRAGATVDLNYAGYCDMGPFGTDTNFNCLFYSFAPPQSGLYTFSTCNTANHDTRLSIQTTCDVSTVVACNDDAAGCAAYTSIMTADLQCGVSYIVAIGGYSATTPLGTGTLNVSVANGQPCAPPCPADLNGDTMVGGLDLTILLGAWGTGGADIDGDGNTGGTDLTIMLGAWGNCP